VTAGANISDDLAAAYRRDGHVVVRGLASADETAPLAAALVPIAARARERLAPMAERSTYDQAFLQMFNLWRTDELWRQFTLAERYARVAAALLGVPAVRLYHDQALLKEPAGGHTPWPTADLRPVRGNLRGVDSTRGFRCVACRADGSG
jgi:hypothetical protein